jgi:hypothetical protein
MKHTKAEGISICLCDHLWKCATDFNESHAMVQVFNHQLLTGKTEVQSYARPGGICGGQSGTGTGFHTLGFTLSVSSHQYSILIFY